MQHKTYVVTSGDHKYALSFKRIGWFKGSAVCIDDVQIGEMSSKELQKGKDFTLPDQSVIHIKLERTLMSYNLQILKDGRPIEGSPGSPKEKVKTAYQLLGFLAGLNLLIGLLATLFNVQLLLKVGMGEYNIIVGLIYGFAVGMGRKERAFLPLAGGFAVFLIDTVMALILMAKVGTSSGLVVRIIIGTPLYMGVKEAWRLSKQAPINRFERDSDR